MQVFTTVYLLETLQPHSTMAEETPGFEQNHTGVCESPQALHRMSSEQDRYSPGQGLHEHPLPPSL